MSTSKKINRHYYSKRVRRIVKKSEQGSVVVEQTGERFGAVWGYMKKREKVRVF